MLSSFLHSFLESSRTGVPFRPAPLPMLGLSEGDKQCIRDRSCIMARHIFADKSEEYITAQVGFMVPTSNSRYVSSRDCPYALVLEKFVLLDI